MTSGILSQLSKLIVHWNRESLQYFVIEVQLQFNLREYYLRHTFFFSELFPFLKVFFWSFPLCPLYFIMIFSSNHYCMMPSFTNKYQVKYITVSVTTALLILKGHYLIRLGFMFCYLCKVLQFDLIFCSGFFHGYSLITVLMILNHALRFDFV